MRYVDRAFAAAVAVSLLGGLIGAFLVLVLPFVRGPFIGLLQARLVAPIKAISQFGDGALLLLVFVNNSVPAVLSFAYPFIIATIHWTPPLTPERRRLLMASFTWLCAFLIGFFGLGVVLSVAWVIGGAQLLFTLLRGALIHGPTELVAILLCVSEPMRLVEDRINFMRLRQDLRLLAVCLVVLFLSAAIEVFTRV